MNLKINLEKNIDDSYEIIFSGETEKKIFDFVSKTESKKILIITDKNLFRLHYKNFSKNLKNIFKENGFEILIDYVLLHPGEDSKNISSVMKIQKKLLKLNFSRKDLILAFGGGMIGDISGFSASIFVRGINFLQIPTTLLSAFDSSIGGKTGINLSGMKNMVGTFYQPKLVIINKNYFKTLPKKQVLSGYFEGLKHSIIDGKESFLEFKNFLEIFSGEKSKENELEKIISKNINVKAGIVSRDEKENGERKFLNYGHTFGHSIELNSDLPHGISIGFGMIFENILSQKLGILGELTSNEINNFILEKLGNTKIKKITFETIFKKLLSDKKNTTNSINFAILEDFGKLKIQKISLEQKDFLKKIYNEFLAFVIKTGDL